jgi:hypothetical protein
MNSKSILCLLAIIAIVVIAPSCVNSLSNGFLPWCDIGSLNGLGTKTMPWSRSPIPDTLFGPDIPHLFTVSGLTMKVGGLDLTNQFIAGEPTPITITTLSPEWRYLGIVMYAITVDPYQVDEVSGFGWTTIKNETKYQVGKWSVSPNDAFQTLFDDICVAHVNSELKPLQSTVWLTVPTGVNKVWIRVLFKIGEQNSGWMVYPEEQTVLKSAFPQTYPDAGFIALAEPGADCNAACGTTYNPNSLCDAARTSTITNMDVLEDIFPQETCNPGLTMSTCSSAVPVINDTAGGYCSFKMPTSCTTTFDCAATDANSHRICVCTDGTRSNLNGANNNNNGKDSNGANLLIPVEALIGIVLGVAALFAGFVAYGCYRKQKFQTQLKYAKAEVPMSGTEGQTQAYRPVMPSGKV